MLWEEWPGLESWSGSFSPTDVDSFVICIKHNDQYLCKDNLTTTSTKGVRPMRLWGKPGMMWPTWLDAGRLGTDASLALAIDHTGVPFAT
jgi:hypothetical protein